MPFDPLYPIPNQTAQRIGLRVEDRRDNKGKLTDWSYGPGGLVEHPGLAYHRFVPIDPGDEQYGSRGRDYKNNHATKFVQAVAKRFARDHDGNGGEPWKVACRTHAARLKASAEGFRALGRAVKLGERTTATRLLVGMGYKNALEVGLTFHHPGGFPYLPGTSIKGLTRAWAEGVKGADKATVKRVFGSDTKQPDELKGEMVAGSVVFLDAVPVRFPPLEADLLNPHVGDYYMDDKAQVAPSDWLSPVPVPFLAVGKGATFRFAVVGRDGGEETAKDVEQAWSWLMAALTDLGAGGKTAAGYGYFAPEDTAPPVPALSGGTATSAATGGKASHSAEKVTRESAFATPPVEVKAGTKNVPAEVIEVKERKAWVRLHAVGMEDATFKMEGKYNADGMPKGTRVLVEVWKEEWDKKAGRPRQVRFQKNFG